MGLSRKSFHLLVKKGVATVEGKDHSFEPCLAMFGMLSDRLQASAPARGKDPAANLAVNAAASVVPQSTENKSGYCEPADTGDFPCEARRCAKHSDSCSILMDRVINLGWRASAVGAKMTAPQWLSPQR